MQTSATTLVIKISKNVSRIMRYLEKKNFRALFTAPVFRCLNGPPIQAYVTTSPAAEVYPVNTPAVEK